MKQCKCGKQKAKRYVLCGACWSKTSAEDRDKRVAAARQRDKDGNGTLRRFV